MTVLMDGWMSNNFILDGSARSTQPVAQGVQSRVHFHKLHQSVPLQLAICDFSLLIRS